MSTYRLLVGPDGQVAIPDSLPGQIVTVTVEDVKRVDERQELTLATAETEEEKNAVKQEILEMAGRLRELLKDELPIDHGRELYGDDGLPR
ncbi:MAG: hypothetical protein KF883_09275 [Thermomicrobiales bacterium]|nr:hypothetical protein [Thermomicrobiales bacterium]